AKMFARATSLPDTAVAITDLSNPTSAEAYDASQYELIAEAEGATDDWSPYLRRAVVRALAMANGIPAGEIPPKWATIAPRWRDRQAAVARPQVPVAGGAGRCRDEAAVGDSVAGRHRGRSGAAWPGRAADRPRAGRSAPRRRAATTLGAGGGRAGGAPGSSDGGADG